MLANLKDNEIYKVFRQEASNLWTVLHTLTSKKQREQNPSLPEVPELVNLDEVYPNHMMDFLESLMFRFRRERYLQTKEVVEFGENFEGKSELLTEEDKAYYKERQEKIKGLASIDADPGFIYKSKQTPVQVLIFKMLRGFHSATAKSRRAQRVENSTKKFLEMIKQHSAANPQLSPIDWSTYLATLSESVDGQLVSLKRSDIVSVKEFYSKPYKKMIFAACCLKWGVEVPQNLSSLLETILANMTEAGYSSEFTEKVRGEIKKRAVCSREVGNNRHGHNKNLKYPGPAHWTQAYDDARKLNFSDKKKYLIEMKRFTHTVEKWQQENVGNQQILALVNQLSEDYQDARCLKVVKKKVEKRLARTGTTATLTEVLTEGL